MSKVKEIQHGTGETGIFGELFVGLGLLIGLAGITFWVLENLKLWPTTSIDPVAAHADWFILSFLLFVEGLGFLIFGIMIIVSGWDRQRHPDIVH